MGKTSYKSAEELVKELSKKINELNKGKLNLEELNALVDNGRDLYEQLVVLRYKAFDTLGEPENKTHSFTPETVEKEITKPETPKEEHEEEQLFDFTNVINKDPEVESKVEPEPIFDFAAEEEKSDENPIVEDKSKIDAKLDESEVGSSLYDNLKKEDDELSLRKKLQNSPITDIKTQISIAKKFEYISIMFEGDSNAYDESIDFLNTCVSGKDAQLKLDELSTKYNWDAEDKSILNFMELVERRYL